MTPSEFQGQQANVIRNQKQHAALTHFKHKVYVVLRGGCVESAYSHANVEIEILDLDDIYDPLAAGETDEAISKLREARQQPRIY